jgi:hypothetical protein
MEIRLGVLDIGNVVIAVSKYADFDSRKPDPDRRERSRAFIKGRS